MEFKTVNELSLQVHGFSGEKVYTKAGAFIMGQAFEGRNYKFEKVLLGPRGNSLTAALGQVARRFTGENLPLMKVNFNGESLTYYANDQQHVTIIRLKYGEQLYVESENILAFTADCGYSVRFLAQGIVSQKGLATSVLTGNSNNSMVAVLSDGNPLVLSNTKDGSSLTADPDAIVCWIGSDPQFKMDLSWKNLLGQASGESYMFQWDQPATILVQPSERKSGIDLSMDGKRTGQHARMQDNQTINDAMHHVGDTLQGVGSALNSGTRRTTGNRSSRTTLSGLMNDLLR